MARRRPSPRSPSPCCPNAAARLWTLEHLGLPLDQAAQDPQLRALLGAPLAAALAARKARHFARDRRPITVQGVRVFDGQVHLETAWVTEATPCAAGRAGPGWPPAEAQASRADAQPAPHRN